MNCLKSGNPCGTDTCMVGHPCQCENCKIYLYNETIEKCATIAETQERGTQYQWVSDSLFECLTKMIANRIRTLKK